MVSSTATSDSHADPAPPRVVAIGASAGGLVAIEEFLQNVPPRSGLAFLVVQHLDPTQKAMLPELLQRVTRMPVREAQSQMQLEANHVYTIPPNAELRLANGRLRVETPDEPRGMRLPINVLFSSLAGARGDEAIAVILSGMGSDGTLGMQAVKSVGGLAVVQQPDSAQFDSMPQSAISAGCADIVAPPAELPAKIMQYIALQPIADVAIEGDRESQPESLQQIFELLLNTAGHDFSLYKPRTLHRRIERRMAIHGIATVADYSRFLRENPKEIDLLFKELLIGVTSFFRDPAVWGRLAIALPNLLARRSGERMLRAWAIGCSTGEEAYSLAMVFEETVQRLPKFQDVSLQIFASDLSADAITTARRGQYPASIRETVSRERLERFFTDHETYFQINSDIRDSVLFAHHDVVLDPPFTKLDLITCRNLLIYFDSSLQQKLIPLFHYSLRPGGLLLLGSAETVGKFGRLFAPLDAKLRLYQRNDEVSLSGPEVLVTSFPPISTPTKEHSVPHPPQRQQPDDNLQTAADRVLLQVHSPAAVVLNGAGDIVYISGRTGNYLEPAAGKANWNFHAMVREGLREPLVDAIGRAAHQSEPLQLHGLQVHLPGVVHTVDVTVQALHEPAALKGMTMIVFRDLDPSPRRRRRRKTKGAADSPDDQVLQQYRDEIQALREESRASKEELQSANEELQSTNEELQSTNEELTTSKEEMQSMNEELQTINTELQSKLDDLALAQSDMQNLLNSIEIAILFLDQDLNVRRFTNRAAKIINLRESDVGRPLSDLTTVLRYPDLHDDAMQTLRTLEVSEKQVLAEDDRWFSVRIMPYRTLDDRIAGVVITLLDITESKILESTLRQRS